MVVVLGLRVAVVRLCTGGVCGLGLLVVLPLRLCLLLLGIVRTLLVHLMLRLL